MNYERSDNLSGQIEFVRVIFLAWICKEKQGFPSRRYTPKKKTMTSDPRNGEFWKRKVHIKSVWEKNEESLLVISYFPHFG